MYRIDEVMTSRRLFIEPLFLKTIQRKNIWLAFIGGRFKRMGREIESRQV
jgi:hypothetical protein